MKYGIKKWLARYHLQDFSEFDDYDSEVELNSFEFFQIQYAFNEYEKWKEYLEAKMKIYGEGQ